MITKFADKIGLLDLLAPRRKKDGDEEGGGSTNDGYKKETTAPPKTSERTRRLRAQLQAERLAESNGVYAKKQRVRYHHRATDSHYDAVVVGVHFDDGPDKPYYTIRYSKPDVVADEDGGGSESVVFRTVEKQTDPDRIEKVPWDEDKVWEVLRA